MSSIVPFQLAAKSLELEDLEDTFFGNCWPSQ